jgi:mitosis inhibitor protein kinase SWE1
MLVTSIPFPYLATPVVMDYSPHRDIGGTLHLPSPTFAHHIDTVAASDLRRSMSRSPSKPQRYLYTQTPTRPSASSLSPLAAHGSFSPQLPPPQSMLFSLPPANTMTETPPPPKKKFPVSFKRPHRSTRNNGSTRSPMRRALGDASHQGNVTPFLSRSSSGEENNPGSVSTGSSVSRNGSEQKPPLFRFDSHNAPAPVKFDPLRPRSHTVVAMSEAEPARSSPLKRGDGAMDVGQASLSTPVKRRSLHGGIFNGDYDVFNQSSPLNFDTPIGDATENERPAPMERPLRLFANNDLPMNSFSSPVMKRAGSLRKSQRQGHMFSRSRGFQDSSHDGVSQSSPANKARNRMSMDASLLISHSPFVSRPSNSGSHPVYTQTQAMRSTSSIQDHQPHPLSRSVVPSSSGSSLIDDSMRSSRNTGSTNEVTGMEKPPLPHVKYPAFSKSLPIGALRPSLNNSNTNSTTDSFATPASFKSGKHLGGYMSTGLISKRNRNPDYHPYNDTDRYAMPDTPSKRASFPPVTTTPLAKSQNSVFANFQDLGTPLPNHPPRTSITNLFRRSANKGRSFGENQLVRRSSFVSEDGEDRIEKLDSHSSADELPPTPTKANASASGRIKPTSLRSSIFGRRTSLGPDTFLPIIQTTPAETESPRLVRKGEQFQPLLNKQARQKDLHVDFEHVALFDQAFLPRLHFSHAVDVFITPYPVSIPELPESPFQSFMPESPLSCYSQDRPRNVGFWRRNAKPHVARIVTPIPNSSGHSSPNTPQGAFTPPEGSTLFFNAFKSSTNSNAIPATPTAQKDHPFGLPPAGVTQNDVDTSITSRFASVTTLAQGEFSIVYKVEKPVDASALVAQLPHSPGKAWVVKKSKKPYLGARDRQRKIREVDVLRVLRGRDHILEFMDCWENDGHLYIQTEFCENGNLSKFLAETGNKARLDDFRIWKILLEMTMGVKAIHDSGFIHLDLKPANMFIGFDGCLKIGDFGLASSWPAPKDIDGEGDREYISPEVLHGRFDKPADVFAVGLITLEIAGNFFLPDNGDQWQRLRSGNLSDIPSLTWSSDSKLERDENGDPIEEDSPTRLSSSGHGRRHIGLEQPPTFMRTDNDPNSLDRLVEWMLLPNPDERPTMEQVYLAEPIQWVATRRRAGATVFEGNWGPADHAVEPRYGFLSSDGHSVDVEMSDV